MVNLVEDFNLNPLFHIAIMTALSMAEIHEPGVMLLVIEATFDKHSGIETQF